MKKHALSLLLAAAVIAVPLHQAAAQKMEQPPMRGGGGHGHRGGGGGWGGLATGLAIGVATGIILSQPPAGATEAAPQRAQRPNQPQRNARGSGVPAAGETRMVPDEVVIELPNTVPAATINSVQQRHRLTRLETQTVTLTGTTFYRWRIPDRRSVAAVVRALEADTRIASAQPNYRYTLQQDVPKAEPAALSPDRPAGAATTCNRLRSRPRSIRCNMPFSRCGSTRRTASPRATMCWSP